MNKKNKFLIFLSTVWLFTNILLCQSTTEKTTQQQTDPFEQAVKNISSADPYLRRQAAEELGMLRDIRAVPYLRKLLKDENSFVRQTAVESLGLLRAQDALDDILNVLVTDKDVQVRQSAIVALGYLGISEKKVINSLIKILQEEEPLQLKYAACNTLSILRSTEPIPVLTKLISSEDINLRLAVIYALGKILHPDSISVLRDALDKNLTNEMISVDIIRILIDLSDITSVEKFRSIYSTTTVTEKVKFFAAYGIAKLAQDASVLPTIKKYLKSSDEIIKNAAVEAVGFIGDRECLNILLEMQKTESSPYTKQLIDMSIARLKSKYSSVPSQPGKPAKTR